MTNPSTVKNSEMNELPALDQNADLETVLEAWHTATLRLEQTHRTLRDEVERLRHELEIKNRQLARKDRLADLGRMASHVAHEVRNNLVPVELYMSLLRRRLSGDENSLDVLGKIESGMTALDATVNDLLHFTSEREPDRARFSVASLLEEICTSLAPQLNAQQIDVTLDISSTVSLLADRHMVRRALLNLVLNALDAMPKGGSLICSVVASNAGAEITVADTGAGLSETARQRAMEPFFTTKSSGTGLGLAIVERVAQSHGGTVILEDGSEGGAAVTMRIPNQRREAAA